MSNNEYDHQNIKYLETENDTYISNIDVLLCKDQNTLIIHLKSQIQKLQFCLSEKNKEIIEAERQSNFIKINYVKIQEELLIKNATINNLTNQNSILKLTNASLSSENEDIKHQYLLSNHKEIELNQRIISIEHYNTFQKKLEVIGNDHQCDYSDKEKEYLIEVTKLLNKINELEIENAQLSFDNKRLQVRLEELASNSHSEIQMNRMFFEKTIDSYQKAISDLNSQIIENSENETKKIKHFAQEINSKQSSTNKTLLIQLNQIKFKARAIDTDNYILTKRVKQYEDEIGEYKIYMTNKDKIIEKLQKDLDELVIDYKKRIDIAESNSQMKTKEIEEKTQKYEGLMQDLIHLTKENNELQIGLEGMSNSIKETNAIVKNKIVAYEDDLNNEIQKNKSYKEKICHLKKKINELYSIIESNKNEQIKERAFEQRLDAHSSINSDQHNNENLNLVSILQTEDLYEKSQRKTIEDYRQILKNIDMSLFNNKKITSELK